MYKFVFIFLIGSFILSACSKDEKNNNTSNTHLNICSTALHELTIDGVDNAIVEDTAYALNTSFYTLHTVKSGLGCSFDFGTPSYPTEGNYSITSSFTDVNKSNNKVYIELFINGTSFRAQSGTVIVTGIGNAAIIEFCKVQFKNSLDTTHQVSLKSTIY
jgi:hypothetical protein